MRNRYTFKKSLSIGGDTPTWEGEIEVSFAVEPGEPETGPSYACGGTPASYAYVDDIRLEKIDGKARPWGDPYQTDKQLEELMLSYVEDDELLMSAGEDNAADESAYQDYRWEDSRDRTARHA